MESGWKVGGKWSELQGLPLSDWFNAVHVSCLAWSHQTRHGPDPREHRPRTNALHLAWPWTGDEETSRNQSAPTFLSISIRHHVSS